MTTEEGNKLIAEFMGVKCSTIDNFYYYGNLMHAIPVLHPDVWRLSASELKYHTSWDWQVPVFGKIGAISQKYACDEDSATRHNKFCDDYEMD